MLSANRNLGILPAVLFLFVCRPALAAEQFDAVAAGFRVLWGLLIVLAVMFVLYALLRKRLSSFQQHGKGLIKIIETKHIPPKKTILLIEVHGKEYLVGAGSDTINAIIPLQHGASFSSVLENTEKSIER